MTVIVTLDMYSGRPNPSWELTESQAKALDGLLSTQKEPTSIRAPASFGRLGYRGLILTTIGEQSLPKALRVFDGILESTGQETQNFVDPGSEVELFLVGTAGPSLGVDELAYVQQEVQKNSIGGTASSLKELHLLAVPPFDPGKWNSDPVVLRNNNCYNYANDKITNTFAQPGRGSGQGGPYPPSCAGTGSAAERDGQRPIPSPDITPAEGQIICLVISTTPGFLDYHWYRRDSNTMWSHKPGGTPARNVDNANRPIADPRTCDRGPYGVFCGFYHCVPSQARIR